MLELIPVRHPMVLVDRVESLVPGVEITTAKAVSGGDPCYAGMAEGLPAERYAFPRSLIIESFGQSSALLWLGSENPPGAADIDWVPLAGRIRDCHFHGSAYPGDVIRHTVRLHEVRDGTTAFMSGETRVGDRTVFTVGQLTAVRRPATVLARGERSA
ncbi:hypothetical protein ACZ90_48820 [Streptomyces albus subsp. albus]|nr:hypothetical protein ACZ90_48820 [Streptomyces albus subsp. albus]